MALERRYQVFISSTYADLVDERREVVQALLELDCIPAGMELFPAANDDQWLLITKIIDDCDYYLVIVGGRYGSISENGISYTEREYDYALGKSKPILGFVHEDPGSIPAARVDIDASAVAKLEEFRRKVRKKPVRTYKTPEELGGVVSRSLIKLIKSDPAEGWVRGRFAVTPEMNDELSQLRARVAEDELRRVTAELAESRHLEQFNQGEDPVSLDYVVKEYDWADHELLRGTWTSTWDNVFAITGPVMMDEAAEKDIRAALGKTICDELEADGKLPILNEKRRPNVYITVHSFGVMKVQFAALRLIEKGVKKRYARDSNTYWKLTARGEEYLVSVVALRSNNPATID